MGSVYLQRVVISFVFLFNALPCLRNIRLFDMIDGSPQNQPVVLEVEYNRQFDWLMWRIIASFL